MLEDAQNESTGKIQLLSCIWGGSETVVHLKYDLDSDGGPCLYVKNNSIQRDQNQKGLMKP